jgi:hypothetical protein
MLRRRSKRIAELRQRALTRAWWVRQARECEERGYVETAEECRLLADPPFGHRVGQVRLVQQVVVKVDG